MAVVLVLIKLTICPTENLLQDKATLLNSGVAGFHKWSNRTFFFFFTPVTGPRRSLSLKLRDTRVYEPQIRAHLGTTAHFFPTRPRRARRKGRIRRETSKHKSRERSSLATNQIARCEMLYRGTSLIRKRFPLGPYSRPMPMVLQWS